MVRATFAGFTTALSAIHENQKRLDIVGQNLANMNTVGYTRQQLETSSINYTNPVSHYNNGSEINVGFGVRMDRVSQIRDPYLDVQYRDQIAESTYNDAIQVGLDSLAKILDETNISGIRQAFDDIQSTLTNMQDPSKINNPIYESELQIRMQSLANLLNDAARQIEAEEVAEFQRLDGTGTNEQGAIQRINEILQQVGELNHQIKRNQIQGQPSLELMDERNVLLDELASYVPIEVSYTNERRFEDWPDDLHVDLLYTDGTGVPQKLRLIDGTNGNRQDGDNFGSVSLASGSIDDPTKAGLTFTAARGETTGTLATLTTEAGDTHFSGGSVQAGLDMLGKDGDGLRTVNGADAADANDTVRGYQYYMKQLNLLAKTFVNTINGVNTAPTPNGGELLQCTAGEEALTIALNQAWVGGTNFVSKSGNNTTDTVLAMLASMSAIQPDLDNNSFADFMNHVSTVLANDSRINQAALTTNVTILNGIQDSRDSVSAVSLDEEAANMMAFQSAYNAASRLMTTLDQMLDTLINSTGIVGL